MLSGWMHNEWILGAWNSAYKQSWCTNSWYYVEHGITFWNLSKGT